MRTTEVYPPPRASDRHQRLGTNAWAKTALPRPHLSGRLLATPWKGGALSSPQSFHLCRELGRQLGGEMEMLARNRVIETERGCV
jgi:hypothetical protein